jgi:hypothetical protein
MKLLTKEILKKFPKWRSTDGKPEGEVKVIAKFFNPTGAGTWYATEFDGEDSFFGYAVIFEGELGYFSLSELQSVRGRFGLGIERDLHWNSNTTLADVMEGRAR